MTQTNQIINSAAPAVHSSFVDYLRAQADEYERNASRFEGSSIYPPSYWAACAAESRQMADDFARIEGLSS